MPRVPSASHVELAIDANRIARGLYQGARPPVGHTLRHLGFGTLVLAAEEHQPPSSQFPGVEVVHVSLTDDGTPLSSAEWQRARHASALVRKRLQQGRRVLVTCWMGLNRSGIIVALTLLRMTRRSVLNGEDAVMLVKQRRPGAMTNAYFVDAVRQAGG